MPRDRDAVHEYPIRLAEVKKVLPSCVRAAIAHQDSRRTAGRHGVGFPEIQRARGSIDRSGNPDQYLVNRCVESSQARQIQGRPLRTAAVGARTPVGMTSAEIAHVVWLGGIGTGSLKAWL